ncbi:MAG: hypothetical protein BWY25_01717 [Chloroflexi bacterium ADurb.Bin222]|nr:MAG: hypothetical protein BWY25_01717 [Chloroflexi bacterium ADurb.Bin222]
MIVVADATPLIALTKIGRLDLLQHLFGEVSIPEAVYAEVTLVAPHRPGADEIRQAQWVHTVAIQDTTKMRYLRIEVYQAILEQAGKI